MATECDGEDIGVVASGEQFVDGCSSAPSFVVTAHVFSRFSAPLHRTSSFSRAATSLLILQTALYSHYLPSHCSAHSLTLHLPSLPTHLLSSHITQHAFLCRQ
jgi:hypothetical protein